jgi:CRP/FNR family transcriptional regulator
MRLIMMNKRLADMTGSVEVRDGETFISLALARQELADLLGTTLETTIRLMSRWQKECVVLTERDGFVIPNVDALRTLEP